MWQSSASNKVTYRPRSHDTTPVGSISLPYIQGATEALSCTIRKAGVQVHAKPTNTAPSGACWFPLRINQKSVTAHVLFMVSPLLTVHLSMSVRLKGPLSIGSLNIRKTLPPLGPTSKRRTTSFQTMYRFWTLIPDISNVASRRPTTLHLWSQTLIRTKADTAYLQSTIPSSSHVTAGHPVGHMTNFPLPTTF